MITRIAMIISIVLLASVVWLAGSIIKRNLEEAKKHPWRTAGFITLALGATGMVFVSTAILSGWRL